MPPKKSKPNGFIMFAQELKKTQGRKYTSLKEACDAAAPLWARMSKDDRQPYINRSHQGNRDSSQYTSEGLDVQRLKKEESLKRQASEVDRYAIRSTISLAHHSDELETEMFFLIDINIFCHYQMEDRYWPAEISVLCFNLKDGVKPENIFHSMIMPGPMPIGYKFDAKKHSDETHHIPVPYDDNVETNMEEVYFELKEFLDKKKMPGVKSMPMLYANKKYTKMIKRILNLWGEEYEGQTDIFNVYEIQLMLYYLRNTVAGDEVWNKMSFSERQLEKDIYAYVSEIACLFHAHSYPVYCTKSIVTRYAYIICDNCCPDLNIGLIEGQHVPFNADLSAEGDPQGSSNLSSKSSQFGGRSKRRGFNSDIETESSCSDRWESESTLSTGSTSTVTSNTALSSQPCTYFPETNHVGDYSLNSSDGMSYAGASGSGLPPAFENSISQLTLNPSKPGGNAWGRVYSGDSDSSSVSDFPALEQPRGRGRLLLKKLNKEKPVGTQRDAQ
ncbi:protein maelstrom homolog [Anthonomus grandis grandis]|uniref:protein maelstrom homolog n=1 Tax=Anthonomus grandis grandis TaxID=2921223 RepID=UPI002165889A|nr:protein maelstrom homolog [Anthonomus grandis grandis]